MGNTNSSAGNIWTRPDPLISFKGSRQMSQPQTNMQDQNQEMAQSRDESYMQNMENQMDDQMQNMENQMQDQRRYDQNMQDYRRNNQDQIDELAQTSPERLIIKTGDRTLNIRGNNEGKFHLNKVMGPDLVYLTCDRGQIYVHGNRSGRIALKPDKRGRYYVSFDNSGKVILQSHY